MKNDKHVLKRISCIATLLAGCLTAAVDAEMNTKPITPEEVDLIISADYLVTMDADDTVIRDGALAIKHGVIIAIDNIDTIQRLYRARQVINGTNRLLMPGLINAHTHAAMTLFRGIADDLALLDWLNNYIFPAEIRFVDERFVRTGTQLACLEMIKSGTTTFVDMYFHPKEIARVVQECGLRAIIGAAVIEQQSGYSENFAEAMRKAISFIEEWREKDSRITPAIAAHAAYTIGPDNLSLIRQQANAHAVPVLIHLSESQAELDIIRRRYGNTPIQHLAAIDFFSGPTIGAHVVWPTAEEMRLLAEYRVAAIHNPTSNMKLASGFAPVPQLLEHGVAVGLGTDGAASNNDLDMWDEIHLAALLHKGKLADPEVMPAISVLAMATRGGARALGLAALTGSLSVGKRADVIQVSLDAPHLTPLYDVISHLVYATAAQDVRNVIVDGQLLMRERRVLTLDEAGVIAAARAIAADIDQAIRTEE